MNFKLTGAIAVGALTLAGCASFSYLLENYQGIDVQHVAMPDDEYKIFDNVRLSKMLVSSSNSHAAGQGLQQGLLLNLVDATPPKVLFRAAAEQYLIQAQRPNCHVTDGDLIISPEFEFRYVCEVKQAKAK